MEKFKNKYRVPSARAQWWDYGRDAAYFITICTANREHFFGQISNGKMQLSPIGVIADMCWFDIKHHAKHIELGAFVVMPNHIHGILILDGNNRPEKKSQPMHENEGKTRFQNQGKNTISAIVGSYKSAVSKHARRLGFEFAWQPRFHDHIIRDEPAFQQISNYVLQNPLKWQEDTFYVP